MGPTRSTRAKENLMPDTEQTDTPRPSVKAQAGAAEGKADDQ